jgi:SNF2 family DNA or RNA helicase
MSRSNKFSSSSSVITPDFSYIQMIDQPRDLTVKLFQHQLASVHQLEMRERDKRVIDEDITIESNIGIFADMSGYGKSTSIVTLIHRNKMQWDISKPYIHSTSVSYAKGKVRKLKTAKCDRVGCTLVLASTSIIHQWYQEFLKSTVSVKMITTKADVTSVIIENYDVILVIPTMFNLLISEHHGIAWKRFVYDEPSHLKVANMKTVIAGFIWFVTATPLLIVDMHKSSSNKNNFMYDIFNKESEWMDFLRFLLVKNDDAFIQYSYTIPPTTHLYIKCRNPIYQTVNGLVSNRITEMIESGNVAGALKALGGTFTDNIISLIKQKKLEEIDTLETRVRILHLRSSAQKAIDTVTGQIDRVKIQLLDLDRRYGEMLEGDCGICMQRMRNPVLEPNCQNLFCGECLLTWLKTKPTCPLCRANVDHASLISCQNSNTKVKNVKTDVIIKSKIDTVIDIITRSPHTSKFIIFSTYEDTFIPIKDILSQHNIEFAEIRGSLTSRQKSIKSYKEGSSQVMFLDTKYNGAGINLQETTDIIIYHEMRPDIITQIIGRANRIGRVDPLSVHHLQI